MCMGIYLGSVQNHLWWFFLWWNNFSTEMVPDAQKLGDQWPMEKSPMWNAR